MRHGESPRVKQKYACVESVLFQIYVPGNRIRVLDKVVARIQRNLYYLFIYARSLLTDMPPSSATSTSSRRRS